MTIDTQVLVEKAKQAIKLHSKLSAGIAITIAIALFNYIVSSQIDSQKDKLAETKTNLEKIIKITPNFTAIQNANQTILDLKTKFAAKLFDLTQNTQILAWFFSLEAQTGVKINTPEVDAKYNLTQDKAEQENAQPPPPSDLYDVTYNLQAVGTYPQILKLLYFLQNSAHLATISSFTLTKNDVDTVQPSTSQDQTYEEQVKLYQAKQAIKAAIKIHLIGCFK